MTWQASCLMGLILKSFSCLAESLDRQKQLPADRQLPPHIAAIISLRAAVPFTGNSHEGKQVVLSCWYSRMLVRDDSMNTLASPIVAPAWLYNSLPFRRLGITALSSA